MANASRYVLKILLRPCFFRRPLQPGAQILDPSEAYLDLWYDVVLPKRNDTFDRVLEAFRLRYQLLIDALSNNSITVIRDVKTSKPKLYRSQNFGLGLQTMASSSNLAFSIWLQSSLGHSALVLLTS